MSKEMVIYWYTVRKQFGSIEPSKTWCIGEADPASSKYFGMTIQKIAETRVKEELGKYKDGARISFADVVDLGYDCFEFPNPGNKERGMDKDIHAVLKSIDCPQIATEWFDTSVEQIKSVIDHVVKGTPIGKKYKLRSRQEEAVKRFMSACANNETRFGLFAMPRFGKTIVSFEFMNKLFEKYPEKKYIFFISAKLDAEQAIREDYYKFDQSCNFKLFLYDSRTPLRQDALLQDKYVFFASKQWFDGKNLADIQKVFPGVNERDCAAVFFDEAHFARMTPNAQRTIRMLNPCMQIDITGTPFRLKSNEEYNDNNSYVYSVLDEYADWEKAENKELFRINNPEMVYITPKNEFFVTDSSFGEFFDSENCMLVIKDWLRKTFYGGQFNINGHHLNISNAVVVLPPRKRYCDLFAAAVKELAETERYAIKCTKTSTKDNDDDDYIADNQERFKKWNHECKHDTAYFHLLVTIGKGLQAVSFPDCHAVIMLNDMTSPEQYIQAAFRSKTPNGTKKEAFVIDYNKGRTLQIVDTFIKNHLFVQARDENYKQEYERALGCINIRDHALVRQNYTFEEIFQTFVSSWDIERITDSVYFDLDKLASKIDLSQVKLADLQKPHQLSLQLTDRGDDYEEKPDAEPGAGSVEPPMAPRLTPDWLEDHIEKLKTDLIAHGYIPSGGTETDRITTINPEEIQRRSLPVGINGENAVVWSYLGGDGTWDDIYIDEAGRTPSTVRWKYVENNKFVRIGKEESHGDGPTDIKKVRAFINAIIRYMPAYFFVSGVPSSFDDFKDRFGRKTVAENYPERKLFRDFMGQTIDYRYVLEILKACDAASREQIIAYCADKVNKCYDHSGRPVPDKVLDLLWIYKKDGSRPVPQILANKMRQDRNYDLVVCGGYWLTDDTTKMYITDSFSEAKVMEKLRPMCNVIYTSDIVSTLEKNKDAIMKFTAFIMNPPYGRLHLPILRKMTDLVVKRGGTGVSLQPIKWLQDKYRPDYEQYKDVKEFCYSIKYYSAQEASKDFNILQEHDMGIYCLAMPDEHKVFQCEELLNECVNKDRFINDYEHYSKPKAYNNEPYFVAIRDAGHMDRWWTYLLVNYMGAIINGRTDDGLTPEQAYYNNPQTNHNKTCPKILGFEFSSETEARNFIHNSRLLPFIAAMIIVKDERGNPFNKIPKIPVDRKYTDLEMEKYLGLDGHGIDYSRIKCFIQESSKEEWDSAREYMKKFA